MLPLLAVCYHYGVIPLLLLHSRERAVRKIDDPRRFNFTAVGFLVILIVLPFLGAEPGHPARSGLYRPEVGI